ncbi:hypothetical protein ACGRHY_29065 [Streptomyces sp. HK10]|uniref:hypothetical protein n=1 Tax=Streptomyces sp. HK10 TaxID=3373255 RepID=UPI0037493F36
MNALDLPSFPPFRLLPTAGPGAAHDVVGPDDQVVGQVDTTSGFRGRAGRDTGPRRHTASAAAEDTVMFHIALHGLPAQERQPYPGVAEARAAVALIPLQRQEIVDTSARAFYFHALRQPHVAAVLDGLEAVAQEASSVGTRTGCRRVARLLHLVRAPAHALLSEITGEAREWMAFPLARLLTTTLQSITRLEATTDRPPADLLGRFPTPHAADWLLDTLQRTWRELQAGIPDSPAAPASLSRALETLRSTVEKLPSRPCARTERDCRATAAALDAIAAAARTSAAGIPDSPQKLQGLVRELEALAVDGSERLEATARLLADTGRLGTVRTITQDLERAELGPESADGNRPVQVGRHEIGLIHRTGQDGWTGPDITEPYHSPEGAATALVRAHFAREAAARAAARHSR